MHDDAMRSAELRRPPSCQGYEKAKRFQSFVYQLAQILPSEVQHHLCWSVEPETRLSHRTKLGEEGPCPFLQETLFVAETHNSLRTPPFQRTNVTPLSLILKTEDIPCPYM